MAAKWNEILKTFSNIILAVSGIALFYVSTMRLIDPSAATFLKTYLANTGNALTTEMSSEFRGAGAGMVLSGITAILAIFIPRLKVAAFFVLSVLFGGVVLGRAVSWVVDGVPDASLFMVLTHEAIFAVANLFCLAAILVNERTTRSELPAPAS